VLGTTLENSFMSSMLKSNGDLMSFFSRPISAGLGALVILLWLSPLLVMAYKKFKNHRHNKAPRIS
jgi:TctA family transporter